MVYFLSTFSRKKTPHNMNKRITLAVYLVAAEALFMFLSGLIQFYFFSFDIVDLSSGSVVYSKNYASIFEAIPHVLLLAILAYFLNRRSKYAYWSLFVVSAFYIVLFVGLLKSSFLPVFLLSLRFESAPLFDYQVFWAVVLILLNIAIVSLLLPRKIRSEFT